MAIAHICDEIEKYQLDISKIDNNDCAITFFFARTAKEPLPEVQGELRVDRIAGNFEITAKCGGWTVMPVHGPWEVIHDYLLDISRVEQESSDSAS